MSDVICFPDSSCVARTVECSTETATRQTVVSLNLMSVCTVLLYCCCSKAPLSSNSSMISRTQLTQHQLSAVRLSVQACFPTLATSATWRASTKSKAGDVRRKQAVNRRQSVQGPVQNGGNCLVVSHLPLSSLFHCYRSLNISKIRVLQEAKSSHVSGLTSACSEWFCETSEQLAKKMHIRATLC